MNNNESYYKTLFENLPDPVVVYDYDSKKIINLNNAAVQYSETTKENVVGLTIGKFCCTKEGYTVDRFLAKAEDAFKFGTQNFKWKIQKPSGGTHTFNISLNSTVTETSKQFTLIAKEIDEVKEREETLKIQETFTKNIVKNVPGLFFVYNQNNELILWNETYGQTFNYSKEELDHKELLSFFNNSDHDYIKMALSSIQTTGKVNVTVNIRKRNGILVPYLINAHKTAIGFMGFGIDISDLVESKNENEKLQQQLVQSSKMEAIGNFSSRIVHDIRNLIGGIKGLSDVLQMSIEDMTQLELLNTVSIACNDGEALVEQILQYARKEDIPLFKINLHCRLIHEVNIFKATLINNQVNIITDFNCSPEVYGNDSQFHQIIMNICKNSFQAVDTNSGKITIAIDTYTRKSDILDIGENTQQEFVRIIIADNGIGMSEEVKNRIFEPFFTTKQGSSGTGLGMSSVLKIVEYWNGQMSIESKIGEGTTTTLLFPIPQK